MAKAESKTILKAYSTVESKLPTLPLEDGQLIFVYDKKKIILDNHGVRTVYEQIQTIETEEQRNDLLAPIDSFYFVIETSILWRYSNGHWNQITTSPQEQIDRIVAEGTKQVKAVRDEGQKVLQSIPEDFQTQMETKLNKQQGIENKGKVLVIGEDGNVAPGEVQSGGGDGIAIINTMSGESPLVIPDSAERVNKRLELGGKTEQNQDPPPSPEYPQEIKNSGKWNEETQKYEVDVKITNAEQNWSKEQTLTLTSDRPITKWDRLVEQGREIGWLYKSKVYDGFDGKNNRIELGNKVGNVQHFSIYFASTPNGVGNANSYCDKYIGVNVSWTKEKFGIFCDWNNGVKFFSAPNEKVTNLEEFKAWLIENPLGLAYETLEPEFVPLPQSEQNAIRALKTYYPTTVITVDGGELDPDIKVTYTADTKNYIDNKVSAKVASIIRQYRLNTANLLSLMPMETQAAMIENDTNNILENAEEMKHE